jgi:hypothetical protein
MATSGRTISAMSDSIFLLGDNNRTLTEAPNTAYKCEAHRTPLYTSVVLLHSCLVKSEAGRRLQGVTRSEVVTRRRTLSTTRICRALPERLAGR